MSLVVSPSGDSSNPPLVLIHGWGFGAAIWDGLLPELEAEFSVYRVSLPGFDSDADEAAALTDLDELADRLAAAIPTPALWLGWSLGGTLAAAVAARHPGQVSGLLTLATNPCFVAQADWPGMAPATFDAFYSGIGNHAAKTLGRFLLLQGQGDGAAKAVMRALKPALAVQVLPAALLAGLDRLAEDRRGYFDDLSMPRRYLFGDGDVLVPVAVAESPLLADQAQVIGGVGHALFISARAELLTALRQLQRDVATGGAR